MLLTIAPRNPFNNCKPSTQYPAPSTVRVTSLRSGMSEQKTDKALTGSKTSKPPFSIVKFATKILFLPKDTICKFDFSCLPFYSWISKSLKALIASYINLVVLAAALAVLVASRGGNPALIKVIGNFSWDIPVECTNAIANAFFKEIPVLFRKDAGWCTNTFDVLGIPSVRQGLRRGAFLEALELELKKQQQKQQPKIDLKKDRPPT